MALRSTEHIVRTTPYWGYLESSGEWRAGAKTLRIPRSNGPRSCRTVKHIPKVLWGCLDNTRRQPIYARYAQQCWTGAITYFLPGSRSVRYRNQGGTEAAPVGPNFR